MIIWQEAIPSSEQSRVVSLQVSSSIVDIDSSLSAPVESSVDVGPGAVPARDGFRCG